VIDLSPNQEHTVETSQEENGRKIEKMDKIYYLAGHHPARGPYKYRRTEIALLCLISVVFFLSSPDASINPGVTTRERVCDAMRGGESMHVRRSVWADEDDGMGWIVTQME